MTAELEAQVRRLSTEVFSLVEQLRKPQQPRWEYKVLEGDPNLEEMQSQLTTLGIRGWELVSTTSSVLTMPVKAEAGATGYATTEAVVHTLVLRRQMRAAPEAEPSPTSSPSSPQSSKPQET